MARPKKVSLAKVGRTIAKGEPHPPTAPKTEPTDVKQDVVELEYGHDANRASVLLKSEPDGPMSLADVNAILADNYPGFVPTNVKGEASGLIFALPGGGSIKVERAKVKKCANMEELRAYIDSVK